MGETRAAARRTPSPFRIKGRSVGRVLGDSTQNALFDWHFDRATMARATLIALAGFVRETFRTKHDKAMSYHFGVLRAREFPHEA